MQACARMCCVCHCGVLHKLYYVYHPNVDSINPDDFGSTRVEWHATNGNKMHSLHTRLDFTYLYLSRSCIFVHITAVMAASPSRYAESDALASTDFMHTMCLRLVYVRVCVYIFVGRKHFGSAVPLILNSYWRVHNLVWNTWGPIQKNDGHMCKLHAYAELRHTETKIKRKNGLIPVPRMPS